MDAVVVLVVLGSGIAGFRVGLLSSVSSIVGFMVGGGVALFAIPRLVGPWASRASVSPGVPWLILVVSVLGLAVAGAAVGALLGDHLRRQMRGTSARSGDAVLGAVVVMAVSVLVLWLVAGTARATGPSTLAGLVERSAILTALEEARSAEPILYDLDVAMRGHGFPVLRERAPEDLGGTPGVVGARQAVVQIEGRAPECSTRLTGTGWVAAPGNVLTNAHVVAGTDSVTVRDASGQSWPATVVLFDPHRDMAILSVPGLQAPPLLRGPDLRVGDSAAVLGFPRGGPYDVQSAVVRDRLQARGMNAMGEAVVVGEVYTLSAKVEPGNSGGPLVNEAGQVVGLVFARSVDGTDTGYALTLAEVDRGLAGGVAPSRSPRASAG